jgi:uncharacterized lipoprotein YmbA
MKRLLPLFPLLLLAGCLRLERDYPERNLFALEVARPSAPAPLAGPLFGPLRLEPIRVSARFQGKPFIYRIDDLQFQEDTYNRFFADPGDLIMEETARWLRTSGLFSAVHTRAAPVIPDLFLEGHVSALYGDFRRGQGMAVLEMSFTLIEEEGAALRLRFRREYLRQIPLEGRTPAALAAGWSQALAQILAELEKELRGSEQKQPSRLPAPVS